MINKKPTIEDTIKDINDLSNNYKYFLIDDNKKKKYKKKLKKLQEKINDPDRMYEVIQEDD